MAERKDGLRPVVWESGLEIEPVYTAEFGQACYATPTLEDGRIYLRTMERLYCFGVE